MESSLLQVQSYKDVDGNTLVAGVPPKVVRKVNEK